VFIHHCEKLKQKTQWMVHAGKTELQVPNYVLDQHCMMYVAALCTPSELQFVLHRQMKQEIQKDSRKPEPASHSEKQNIEFHTYRWIYSEQNYQRYMQLPKEK
jgi:hypothetical protein